MPRRPIDATAVSQVERLLADRLPTAMISTLTGVSAYVVELIATRGPTAAKGPKPRVTSRPTPNARVPLDAVTVRSVQRMLAGGILNHTEIAREAGVSTNTVGDIAAGRRTAVNLAHLVLGDGESLVTEPHRCGRCHAAIAVVPCRTCAARRQQETV